MFPERSSDPLEFVDYRLAETPEEKDEIYRLRYRAYLREGAILPSESQRVTDRYDDEPNNFIFGVYYRDELYSSIRISVLRGEWRGSPSSEMFADILHPELDRGKIIIDPTRFVADPDKAKGVPRTALPHGAAGLCRLRSFQRRYRACQSFAPSTGHFIARCSCRSRWASRKLFPGLIKPVGLMAADYRGDP